jgi:Zn-dependent M28 family amino/carboxypeptidase
LRFILLGSVMVGCVAEVSDASPVAALPDGPSITVDDLLVHLEALQDVADANNGNRSATSSGYDASVEYASTYLEGLGIDVELHPFELSYSGWTHAWLEAPVSQTEDQTIGMWNSPVGDVTAPIVEVDVMIPPGEENSSTSGCDDFDFDDFPVGSIALIQRGGCTFTQKATLAQEAGAVAVVVFNEGQPDRLAAMSGNLDEGEALIPVMAASFGLGEALVDVDEPIRVVVESTFQQHNVVATIPGDSDDVWIIGGHLDSVPEGPGINDNGSGVSVVLELARHFADEPPPDTLIFGLWGAEELGLLGATAYVEDMPTADAFATDGYLNLDMLASPNPARYIYAGVDVGLPPGEEGADHIADALAVYFDEEELPWVRDVVDDRSDHAPFMARGIPAGGLFAGAAFVMTTEEAGLWDGEISSFDPCYHAACDDIGNVDLDSLEQMALASLAAIDTLMAE